MPGTYTVVASFPGTADYVAIQSAPVTFTIGQGTRLGQRDHLGRLGRLRAVRHLRRHGGRGGAPPTGTVTFFDGGTTLGTAALDGSGTATLTTSTLLGPGLFDHRQLRRRRQLPPRRQPRSGSATVSVARAARDRAGAAAGLQEEEGGALGLKAEVQPLAPGAGVPTGTVIFEIQAKRKKKVTEKVLGTAMLDDGSATLTVKPTACSRSPSPSSTAAMRTSRRATITPPLLTHSALKSLARPMLAPSSPAAALAESLSPEGSEAVL